MSVFRGSIIECPSIIVDHFTPKNCQRGRAFFLSHCHRDHMTGLDSSDLLFALASKNTHLYCSEVTQGLLSGDARFAKLLPLMKSLPIEEPVTIKLIPTQEENTLNITVTLLPAGHCPGSVMFLFHWDNSNVLYTGDFRLSLSELRKIDYLHHEATQSPIDINTLYLDTTFCHDQANTIIPREKTKEIILELVEMWLSADSSNAVYLDCPSFGYEHIFVTLSTHFKTKIHISPWRMKSYSILPEVHQSLTLNGEDTRIHSCGFKKRLKSPGLPCRCLATKRGKGQSVKVLRIKPSTQWFVTTQGRLSHPKVFIKSMNMVRVLHSMHASYSELCEFVTYLSPRSIVPCVIPYSIGDTSIVDLHDRIRKLLPLKSTYPAIPSVSMEDTEQLTIQRKDPVYEGDDSLSDRSDYETDDEYACSDDWEDIVSHDQLSHDQSPDNSFDLSLPAFLNHGDIAQEKKSQQPIIDLSFDEDSASSSEVRQAEPSVQRGESTGDTNGRYSLREDSAELWCPEAKRRKTENEHELIHSPDQSPSSLCVIQSPSSSLCQIQSPSSSLCLIQSPVSVIDLTQSSNSRSSLTPDSVIITGITQEPSLDGHITNRDTPIRVVTPPSNRDTPISSSSSSTPSISSTTPSSNGLSSVTPLRINHMTPSYISRSSMTPPPNSRSSMTPPPVSPHSSSLLPLTPERTMDNLGKKRAFKFI